MSYITLERAKQHLNIDSGYTEDDSYILSIIEVSEYAVERHINDSITGITASNGGVIPAPLLHAMLLMIGNFYSNRESVSMNGKASELPYNYKYLLDFFQNYSN